MQRLLVAWGDRHKTKTKGLGSFGLTGASTVSPALIQLPRLGRVRRKARGCGYLPPTGTADMKIRCARVSEHAGHRYVSLPGAQEHVVPATGSPVPAGGGGPGR